MCSVAAVSKIQDSPEAVKAECGDAVESSSAAENAKPVGSFVVIFA